MTPSEFLMERFDAIMRFEAFFENYHRLPSSTARHWYRNGFFNRFEEREDGAELLDVCRLLEKTVPLDDLYWEKGRGSFL